MSLKRFTVSFFAAALCLFLVFAGYRTGFFLEKSLGLGFRVHNIVIEGHRYADEELLRAVLNVEKGDAIFAFDPRPAKEMLEKVSWVDSAQIERRLPDTLYVRIKEREPMALWQQEGRITVVDNTGIILADDNLERFEELPIIVGEGAAGAASKLLKELGAHEILPAYLDAAMYISKRRWNLKLKNGIIVRLPEDGVTAALEKLVSYHEEEGLLEKDIVGIDLRFQGRLIVQASPQTAQERRLGAVKPGDKEI